MNSMKCPQCGLVNWANAEACKRCRLPINGSESPDNSNWEESSSDTGWEPVSPWSDPAYPGASYSYAGSGQAAQKTGVAIASLIVGIVNMLACGLFGLGSVTGLILGVVALSKAKRFPLTHGGHGLAVAGIVLSVISFLYGGVVLAIAIPNVIASYRAANEGSAIGTLKTIADAESKYQSMVVAGRYATLQELAAAGLIDATLVNGVKHQYTFEVKTNGASYEAMATPVKDSSYIGRSFYLSSNEMFLRAAKKGGVPATAYDPPMNQPEPPGFRQTNPREKVQPRYAPTF
jgi:hypothetical protein